MATAEMETLFRLFQAEGHDMRKLLRQRRRVLEKLFRAWPVLSWVLVENIDAIMASLAEIYGSNEEETEEAKALLLTVIRDALNRLNEQDLRHYHGGRRRV